MKYEARYIHKWRLTGWQWAVMDGDRVYCRCTNKDAATTIADALNEGKATP
jgi:hypothetical protein